MNGDRHKISILVLTSVYPRFAEDAEVPWLRASVRELRDNNCDVTVIAPSHKGIESHYIDGVPIHRFRYAPKNLEILTHDEGAPSKIARNPLLQLLAVPYIISGSIKTLFLSLKLKPDILHVHWPFPHAAMAFFAAFFRKTPIVLNFHGAELLLVKKKKWIRPILKSFIKKADAVLANSGFTAGKIREIFDREVEISPYGSTVTALQAAGDDGSVINVDNNSDHPNHASDKFRVLFVGRHIERKGIEYLIKAAAMLDPDKFQIRIVGQGDLTENLKKLSAEIAPRQVVFTGKISNDDLANEYENAGCFILPAIIDSRGDTEGLGVVMIEAAEYGVPVVASGVGGITDVIINEDTGLIVNQKSPDEIAAAIQRLYDDKQLRDTLADNCKKHIREFFSWERITDKQIKIYHSLLR